MSSEQAIKTRRRETYYCIDSSKAPSIVKALGGALTANIIRLSHAVQALTSSLQGVGVQEVRIYDDVEKLYTAVGQSKKGVVGEHFRVDTNTLPPGQVFWAGALSKKGRCKATIACRFDDTKSWSLDQYLIRYWSRAYSAEGGEPVRFNDGALEALSGISGRIAYFGEAFTHPKWRGRGILPPLHKLLVLQAAYLSEFEPQYIYGWMPRQIAVNALDWGYRTIEPIRGAFAVPPPYPTYLDLCFVGMRCPEDVEPILKNPLEHLSGNQET